MSRDGRSLRRLFRIGADPADTDEQRLQKELLVASTTMMGSLAVLWGVLGYTAIRTLEWQSRIHATLERA